MMRPGQLHPNEFELALLKALAEEYTGALPPASDLHVLSREFTCVGSVTKFLVKGQNKETKRRVLPSSRVISVPELEYGLGMVAFIEGKTLTLELFAYDDHWDGMSDGFRIGNAKAPETTARSDKRGCPSAIEGKRKGGGEGAGGAEEKLLGP